MTPLLFLLLGEEPPVEYGPPAPVLHEFIRLEIALADTAYTTSPTWTDFTNIVRSCSWSYSWSAPDGQVSPSELRVTAANRDGRWDAATGLGGSPWAGNVRPWRQVRVLISTNNFSTSAVLWRGFLADIDMSTGKFDATVELRCTDLAGVLSKITVEDTDRPEELTGDRVDAILTAAGIPAGFLGTIDTGTVAVTAATVSGQALGLIQECARAEGGLFFCGRTGTASFRDRFYLAERVRTGLELVQADIKQVDLPQRLAAWTRIDRAAVQWSSGEVVRAGAAVSGWPETARREMGTSAAWRADAHALAQWLYRVNALSGDQISAVTCDVLKPDTWVLDTIRDGQLQFLDSVEIVGVTPVHGHALSGEFWVAGETHRVDRSGEWLLDLELFPVANAWQTDSEDYYTFGASITSDKVAGR